MYSNITFFYVNIVKYTIYLVGHLVAYVWTNIQNESIKFSYFTNESIKFNYLPYQR